MKFLSLLLSLVILVAVLYQSVFTPMSKNKNNSQLKTKTTNAFQALKEAEKLKQMLNKKNKSMNYEDELKNR